MNQSSCSPTNGSHRLFHVPPVTNGVVDHYTENLAEVIELSKHNSSFSPFDSDAQQFFAAHVYALEVAKGGDACIGDVANAVPPPATPDAAPAASSSPSAAAPPAAATSGKDCHSHADGSECCRGLVSNTDLQPPTVSRLMAARGRRNQNLATARTVQTDLLDRNVIFFDSV